MKTPIEEARPDMFRNMRFGSTMASVGVSLNDTVGDLNGVGINGSVEVSTNHSAALTTEDVIGLSALNPQSLSIDEGNLELQVATPSHETPAKLPDIAFKSSTTIEAASSSEASALQHPERFREVAPSDAWMDGGLTSESADQSGASNEAWTKQTPSVYRTLKDVSHL